jgi:hypothetical protein
MRQLEMRLAHARIKMAGVIKAVRNARARLSVDKLSISVPFSATKPPQPHELVRVPASWPTAFFPLSGFFTVLDWHSGFGQALQHIDYNPAR